MVHLERSTCHAISGPWSRIGHLLSSHHPSFEVYGLGFRVWCLGFWGSGLGFSLNGLGLGVWGFGFGYQVLGCRFRDGLEFGVWGSEF